MTVITKTINWHNRDLTLETGRIANLASGAVLATYGQTSVLCTVVVAPKPKENIDFVPLTVNYVEKAFAAGKIPGGFFKREGRASDGETIASRLIDRTIRPLFPSNFSYEVQIICTVLSYDGENEPDVLSIIGASAALALSQAPVTEVVAGARVAILNDTFVLNPLTSDMETAALNLEIGASDKSIYMVEAGASEISEEQMIDALKFGQKEIAPVIKMIKALAKEAGKDKMVVAESDAASEVQSSVDKIARKELEKIYSQADKARRRAQLDELKEKVLAGFEEDKQFAVSCAFKNLQKQVVQAQITKNGSRIDGRGVTDIRPISTEVSILARTHGSALFTRGETQSIVVTTLGSALDAQLIDSIHGNYSEPFMLHYNFPPYSVGEVAPMRGPGRREIGHGRLAWRAIRPLLPGHAEFPYTIRIVAETTGSNGSSSMATVCGSSLSLMDAGVPLKRPVAGIAMGLVKSNNNHVILSDILGDEDFLGHMDFKVAGTARGITALQMDIKIAGIDTSVMKRALAQALEGRMWILDEMSKTLACPRSSLNQYVPVIVSITIAKDKIGAVIGSGGKTIKDICESTGAKIDISDDGVVSVAAPNSEDAEKAMRIIRNIITDPEVGEMYDGSVVKVMDFGAVVSFLGSREGLLHVSEISNAHVKDVSAVLSVGDEIRVRVASIEDRGRKIRLSMKAHDSAPRPRDGRDEGGSDDRSQRRRGGGADDRNRRPRRSDGRDGSRGRFDSDRPNRSDREDRRSEGDRFGRDRSNRSDGGRFNDRSDGRFDRNSSGDRSRGDRPRRPDGDRPRGGGNRFSV